MRVRIVLTPQLANHLAAEYNSDQYFEIRVTRVDDDGRIHGTFLPIHTPYRD